ncbi:acyl transferase/acyl hydrolase/lysophospholipase [Halenospora varia]|nr:acyl transferase/acyl hydrolase/lysophospholipase [Halenospora varia]
MDNTSLQRTTNQNDFMMSNHHSLKILSLDGGGVRGIASLYILRELMSQVQRTRKGDSKIPLRPCDYFDLICGTSTGGLIAIMLGRLRYTVDQTIELYKSLAEEVFTSPSSNIDAQFDHKQLERIIKDIIIKAPLDAAKRFSSDEMMEDCTVDTEMGGCRTFVVAIRTRGGNQAARLRTYGNDEAGPFEGRIWEAARATSAAPTFFSPVQVADIKYGDGGTGWNNPTREAMYEASVIWPNRPIGCLISLGTGEELPLQLVEVENLPRTGFMRTYVFNKVAPKQSFLVEVAKYCKDSLTSCKTVHDDVLRNQDRDGIRGRYFRFNTPGMGNIGLEEWSRIPDMIALTETYMESPSTRDLKLQAAGVLIRSCPPWLKGIPTGAAGSSESEVDQAGAGLGSRSSFHQMRAIISTPAENPLLDLPSLSQKRPVASLLRVATDFACVSAAFRTLINHGSEFDKLWIFIDSIKVAFRLECANLLALVDNSVKLSDFDSLHLMPNPDDNIPLRQRTTGAAQAKLGNTLGSVEKNLNVLRQIYKDVQKLLLEERITQNTSNAISQDYIASAKDIVLQLKKHKSCLTGIIDTIKADSQHSDGPILDQEEDSALAPQIPPYQLDQRLRGFQIVQRTSTKLYEALGKICVEHPHHSAHFRLHQHFDKKDRRGKPYIPFDLRFSSNNLGSSADGTTWLAIESFFPQHLPQNILEQDFDTANMKLENRLEPPLKRKLPPPKYPSQSKHPKISQQQSTFGDSGYETSITSASSKDVQTRNSKPDFCSRKNFCTRLQAYGQDTSENPARFIGYLEKTADFNHRVSFSPLSVDFGNEEPISLIDMFALTDIRRAEIHIPYIPYERVELAKQLASGMLQFQGTPLLKLAWSSQDVMFFKRHPASFSIRDFFKAPYLLVNMRNIEHKQPTDTTMPFPEPIVYNRCLLSLAIILIEIAYRTPIMELRVDSELEEWDDWDEANDHALLALAMRLQRSINAELGLRYQNILGRCLQACRDPKSRGFEERSFRAEVYTGIIIELEELKQWMVDQEDENWTAK